MADLQFPPLNRLPKGLLDFFGIKSGAWGPRTLGAQLVPTIELIDWYTEPYAQWFNVGTAVPAAAAPVGPGPAIEFAGAVSDATMQTGGVCIVPTDETWYMHEFTAGYSFPALENGRFSIELLTAGNLTSTLNPPQQEQGLGTMPFATGAPAAGGRYLTSLVRKMFWPPGTQFRVQSLGVTALTGVIRGVGRVTRFKV